MYILESVSSCQSAHASHVAGEVHADAQRRMTSSSDFVRHVEPFVPEVGNDVAGGRLQRACKCSETGA